jgi:hypothetical protein
MGEDDALDLEEEGVELAVEYDKCINREDVDDGAVLIDDGVVVVPDKLDGETAVGGPEYVNPFCFVFGFGVEDLDEGSFRLRPVDGWKLEFTWRFTALVAVRIALSSSPMVCFR